MKSGSKSPRDKLDRHAWFLWLLTFVVVISLAAAVPLLYMPWVEMLSGQGGALSGQDYAAIVGLGGLVLVFCLYVVLKQRELHDVRLRLEREEREREAGGSRLSELSDLFQLATTLNLQLRLDDILEIIVRRVVSTLEAQQASIMVYNPERDLLETRASYGLESEFARHARMRPGEGIAGWVAQRRQAVQLDSDPGGFRAHCKANRNITSALSLPLLVGERCVGVLNVNRINHPECFLPHHRDLLQLFAGHVGAVIERAEAMERLGDRARELEVANIELDGSNRLKDLFLSTASHELKTPLTSVIAYAELLDDNDALLTHEQRSEFLRRLRAEADRLLGVIEDILDLTRLETGMLCLRCRSIAVNEIAHAAVETARPLAQRHGVGLRESLVSDLPPVVLDEVRMRQVLVNLLANAVKSSPRDGHVTIETLREGDFVRIQVVDEGDGIAPAEATQIFELFGQGARAQGEQRGMGIGLHLVKRITELHGGHVGLNSRVGEGSTFWVRLPLRSGEGRDRMEAEQQAA